jgi:hypothetical protein
LVAGFNIFQLGGAKMLSPNEQPRMIEAESINEIFEQHNVACHYHYNGICHNCRCSIDVEITKTSRGYGLNGGILYESNPDKFLVQCLDCLEKFGIPIRVG